MEGGWCNQLKVYCMGWSDKSRCSGNGEGGGENIPNL